MSPVTIFVISMWKIKWPLVANHIVEIPHVVSLFSPPVDRLYNGCSGNDSISLSDSRVTWFEL